MSPLLIVGPTLPQADRLREHGGPDVERCKEELSVITAALKRGLGTRIVIVRSELLDANTAASAWDVLKLDGVLVLVVANPMLDDGLRLLLAGYSGLLKPDISIEELLHLLPRVAAGEIWASPVMLSRALRQALRTERQCALTGREQQIFELVSKGLTNRRIAEELCVTRETVRWHLRGINTKLGKNSVEDLRRKSEAKG